MNTESKPHLSQDEEKKIFDNQSKTYKIFKEEFEKKETNEDRLSCAIDFMRKSLAQKGDPDFKGFWEARRLCLPVFKENINPIVRAKLWNDFVELSQEARRLKDILDEETIFAVEQLELAINALTEDIDNFDGKLKQVNDLVFSERHQFLKTKYEEYNNIQKELSLLNAFAGRINSLRKEIIKTEMRLRYKSRFLKNLSILGDKIFPKRKEFIKIVSSKFIEDINTFVEKYFESDSRTPFYILKDEIKSLQNIAKMLTLNTKAFTETRLNLSQCWDKIKSKEGEKRKYTTEIKKSLKDNYDDVLAKIQQLENQCKQYISLKDAEKKIFEIQRFMKNVELQKAGVKKLKKMLKDALKPIYEKDRKQKEQLEKKKEEELKKKNKKLEDIKTQIQKLQDEEEQYDVAKITEEKDKILQKIDELSLNKIEKQMFDRILKPLKDIIVAKKEKAILDLSEDELQTLEKMKQVLKKRQERRAEIKAQLENCRKALGSSGFDFEKAIIHREIMDLEKERLEKINESIAEIEEKIVEIEG